MEAVLYSKLEGIISFFNCIPKDICLKYNDLFLKASLEQLVFLRRLLGVGQSGPLNRNNMFL